MIPFLLAWGAIYTYNRVTDGFSVRQMTSSLPTCPQFQVELTEAKKNIIQKQLSQPFHYIGKGCQFYAFESEDGKYVLKFLKHKHLRPFTWLNSIPMPGRLRERSNAKIAHRRVRVENLFSSCKLAYEEMADETGLLFIHLNRVPALEMEICLIDKLGLKHRISLDQYEYVVQKKGVTVKEAFAAVQSEEQLRNLVAQLMQIVIARCEKGIADRDRSFVQNVAFYPKENRAFFIDTGQFYKCADVLDKEVRAQDLQKRIANLRYWMERYFPEHLHTLDN